MLHDFAQQLKKDGESIVARWLAAMWAEPGLVTARGLKENELRDHLGALILRLAETLTANAQLKTETEEPRLTAGAREDARSHGQTRWSQDYRVDEVVREIAV